MKHTYVLGVSCYYHDAAAALLKDGIIVAASEEERFTRIKHDASFPENSIDFCLRQAGITPSDLTYAVFYEKPFIKFERILLTSILYTPKSFGFFQEAMKKWFFDHLWIKNHILSKLQISKDQLLFSEHHLSHAASSFYSSPYKKAAILTIDGVGEWTTTAWGIGNGKTITLKEEIRFPHSLGLLYSAFTYFCGYEVNDGEYKLMGLAPYGKPRYKEMIYHILSLKHDGSYHVDQTYFSYPYSLRGVYTKSFEDVFGKRNRNPDTVTTYYADIAASIQNVLEEMLIKIASYVYEQTGLQYLSYAGGVALNSKANWLILKNTKFKEIFIQPAAGDSGGAIGSALWAYHSILGEKRTFVTNTVYLGIEESHSQFKQELEDSEFPYNHMEDKKLIEYIVTNLAMGKVVGWVQGRAEWGPRALGHRSILADPRSKKMKDIVNTKIKFREAFRPFAPATIIEKADRYFDIGKVKKQYPFKYMQYVVPVKEDQKAILGAVTHKDGTARPQFVEKRTNPLFHKLITEFGKKTGVFVVLNTSFNLKGEPIVNTAKEAISTFHSSGIDILILGNFVVNKYEKARI